MKGPDTLADNDRLLWWDFEATALNFSTLKPLESGSILTNVEGEVLRSGETHFYDENLSALEALPEDDEARVLNTKNGLLDILRERRERNERTTLKQSEIRLVEEISEQRRKGSKVLLAGTGIAKYDFRIIEDQMPKLYRELYYAPVDVGHFRRMVVYSGAAIPQRYPFVYPSHRALEDAQQSLDMYIETRPLLKGLFD